MSVRSGTVNSMAEFKVEADSEYIRIDGFSFAPAEAEDVKAAASFAGGMRDFPALPPRIPYKSFVVEFSEDGTLVLSRANGDGKVITFSFNTVDTLILAVDSALGISIDKKRHDPSPRHAGALAMFNTGDIIEGKW